MKKTAIFILSLCLLFSVSITAFAGEINGSGSSGAKVSAQVPSSHTLTVTTDGNAKVSYNGSNSNALSVPRLDVFTLVITPDNGYVVSAVYLDGKDVTDRLSDGKLTLSGIYADTSLSVVTAKEKTYPPNVEKSSGGDVEVTPKNPKPGDKVTITPKSEDGKQLKDIKVYDADGNEIQLIDNGDGTYSFIQPEGSVTIKAEFENSNANVKKNTSTTSPKTGADSDILCLFSFALLSSGAAIIVMLKNKRKQRAKIYNISQKN